MKKVFFALSLSLFMFSGCDYLGSFTFKVENSTQETITLKFVNDIHKGSSSANRDENKKEVILEPNEEKVVRILDADLNTRAHDCLTTHGIARFTELIFDTYVDGVKIEKQLWQAENWTYRETSKWSGEYKMIITDEMIKK